VEIPLTPRTSSYCRAAEKFHLNNEEQNYLLTAASGEGLLFAMNDHIPLKVVPSPQEYGARREDWLRLPVLQLIETLTGSGKCVAAL